MTDHQQTSDQRVAAASGAPEDQARVLRHAIRCGEESLDRARLRAFCGDLVARLVVHVGPNVYTGQGNFSKQADTLRLAPWVTVARRLMRPLPDREVDVTCDVVPGADGEHRFCSACMGETTQLRRINAEHWLTTVGALAVGRECWAAQPQTRHHEIRLALDACARWVKDPSAANLRAWISLTFSDTVFPNWVPRSWWHVPYDALDSAFCPQAQAQVAASLLGDRPVIELLDAAWLEVV